MTESKPLLEVIQFTDPYCTWCWGSEPVMRHIEEVYGDQVRIGFVMGGLVPDVSKFNDPLNKIGGPGFAGQVAQHWEDSSRRHGMPVDAKVWIDMKDEFTSTWPACMACKAAEMQDPAKAYRYVRLMREGAAARHLYIHRREVQLELAREAGLDYERFALDLDSGAAEQAFQQDLEQCRDKDVTGFPSFEITNRAGDEFMFFGFQPYPKFVELFERLAGGELVAKEIASEDANILDFIGRHTRVAWRELSEVFSLPKSKVEERMSQLESAGSVAREKAGNGWFYVLS